jgi:hypothetical protein
LDRCGGGKEAFTPRIDDNAAHKRAESVSASSDDNVSQMSQVLPVGTEHRPPQQLPQPASAWLFAALAAYAISRGASVRVSVLAVRLQRRWGALSILPIPGLLVLGLLGGVWTGTAAGAVDARLLIDDRPHCDFH